MDVCLRITFTDFDARRIVENEKYSIQNVAWEDCGWKKGLGLGYVTPNIYYFLHKTQL